MNGQHGRTAAAHGTSGASRTAQEFDWPPDGDLFVYDLAPADPRTASDGLQAARRGASGVAGIEASGDGPVEIAPPAPLDVQAPRRREPSPWLASLLLSAATVAISAGWLVHQGVRAPVPAAAGPTAVVTQVPMPAAAALPVAPPRITIDVRYPMASRAPEPDDLDVPPAGARGASASVPLPDPPAALVDRGAPALHAGPPPDAPPVPLDVLNPSGSLAITSAPAVAVPAPAVTDPAAPIRGILGRYEEAFDRRDVETAAALWPSLDRPALARAFASLERQDVAFDRCDIAVEGVRGSATCVGTVRYVATVGRGVEKAARITWTFDFAHAGDGWRIATLRAR